MPPPKDLTDCHRVLQMQHQFELAQVDYRQRACRERGQYWEHAVERARQMRQPKTPEQARKRDYPDDQTITEPHQQHADSNDREIRRMEDLITKVELRFVELVSIAHELESDLQTLRRSVKRVRRV